ncbi:5E5 antigen-like [Chenopodium quinoa]|uniref:5E5 antigen-like n=1 Tax=Chenopodium quinoa TaxID=63459 RepID=UPI000B77249B|nr:5E5 antigen-like [Chenopodium quinoa]
MTCSLCSVKGHNKRNCPNKDNAPPREPLAKKARGRPRKDAQPPAHTVTTSTAAPAHHAASAQPTQLGRGGRSIRGGRGSRGGGRSARGGGTAGQGRGRGKGKLPKGVGVLFSADGSVVTARRGRGRPRSTQLQQPGVISQSSQASTVIQQTQ